MKAGVGTQDTQLVSAVLASGKVAAGRLTTVPLLAEIYRRHAADVGRWAARLGGPSTDVDDVVQEVFVVVNRQLPRFRGEAKMTTWLFRITDRVVRNHRRWRAVRRVMTQLTPRHGERVASGEATPLEALERHAAVRTAYQVLDQVPDKYRRILILAELEELSGEEIAQLLDVPIATVRVWLHRARRLFLERVRTREADDGEGRSER